MRTSGVLVAAVLVVCVASSADARRRHHGYYGYSERYSARSSLDDWRRAREAQGQDQARGDDQDQDLGQDRRQDRYDRARYDHRRARTLDDWQRSRDGGDWQRSRDDWRRARYDDRRRYREGEDLARAAAAERGDLVLRRGRSGPFGATSEKLVRGCAAQAAEFENWPFDAIERAVGPDETQRNALAALRDAAKQAAQRLTNDCPQDVPAAPAAGLEAVEQVIAATLAAYDTVEPKLQAFYGALNDEQKARLYRDMTAPVANSAAETTGAREAPDERRERYSSRRHRGRDYAVQRESRERDSRVSNAAASGWSGTCEELAAVLRNWPVRDIERNVRLSDAQRVAFYELVTASLKAADTLSSDCPADAALTPVGRMDAMRKRLSAVRAAASAIRPALARFYEGLDQGQKVRFSGTS